MIQAAFTDTIDFPWTVLDPIRVGAVAAGHGAPDKHVGVEIDGRPGLRIDIYPDWVEGECFAFQKKRGGLMSKKTIPDEVRKQVDEIVKHFNQTVLEDPDQYYVTRYKGSYLYLDRFNYGRVERVCRLRYTGAMNKWGFAIYKYSTESYDVEEWFFPGSNHVDGTVEGAMRAGLEAYPID